MIKQLENQINLLQSIIKNTDLQITVASIIEELSDILSRGLPLLVFGNGGSAADALHISGGLVGKFYENRKALKVDCLNSNATIMTAWANDFNYDTVFERQVRANGVKGGFVWGISTSRNSKSVILGLQAAQVMGMKTIGMTGNIRGLFQKYSNFLIDVPFSETLRIQELHIPIYHYICQGIKKIFLLIYQIK
jgi:D-sedoheptulose 7-phosphate isomerase